MTIKAKALILCSLGAFVSFLFCNGSWNIPIMAWIFPILFLIISRKTSPLVGYPILIVIVIIAGAIKYPTYIVSEFPLGAIINSAISLIVLIPFIIDRIFYKMLSNNGTLWQKYLAAFVFPVSYALLELCLSYFYFSEQLSLAVTQTHMAPLLQIASLIGQVGVSFFIAWTCSMVYFFNNYIFENKNISKSQIWKNIKTPCFIFLTVIILVFIYGGLRLAFYQNTSEIGKVAISIGPYDRNVHDESKTLDLKSQMQFFDKSIKEADLNNTTVLVFNETAFSLSETEEKEFLQHVSQSAKETETSCILGLEVNDNPSIPEENISQNKIVSFNASGEKTMEYEKSKLLPIIEESKYIEGNHILPIHTVYFGENQHCNVSVAIGNEAIDPVYLNQLPAETDILFCLTYEWPGEDSIYSTALELRAIEHGTNVVNTSAKNINMVYDSCGKAVLSNNMSLVSKGSNIYTYLPYKGNTPLYSYVGPLLDIIFPTAFVVIVFFAIRKRVHEYYQNNPNTPSNDTTYIKL